MPRDIGWIEVVTGPMFSGKTEELIRRLRRALFAKQHVQVFKPQLDIRYADTEIVSHSDQRLTAHPVDRPQEILNLAGEAEVVGIDEAQFFDRSLVRVASELAQQGRRVVIAGLDQDFKGQPFGCMPELLAIAEFVTKSLAICMVCGNPAGRTQRTRAAKDQVLLGAQEAYEARCRLCHEHASTRVNTTAVPVALSVRKV